MKHILLTGGKGQLGQSIQSIASRYPDFTFTVTDYEELDITKADAIATWFETQATPFDACINCAAYTAVDKAESEEEQAFKLNFEAALYLADACNQRNIQLVHISTDYVFDGKHYRPYKEEDETAGQGIYGSSKVRGEGAVLGSNPAAIILRTSWLYSEFGVNFVKRMKELMQERPSLNVVFDQVGTPTYAVDLATVILDILVQRFSTPDQSFGGVYHYSNEGVTSWYDFAVAIKEITGSTCEILPITSAEYPTPAERPPYSVLNKQKIKSTFGLSIPYWRDSLQKCLQQLQTV